MILTEDPKDYEYDGIKIVGYSVNRCNLNCLLVITNIVSLEASGIKLTPASYRLI